MRTYLVNGEFEIDAPNLETAYEVANEMGIEIDEVDDITDVVVDDGQPTEYDEWMSFDPDC